MATYQFTEYSPSGRFGAVHVLTEDCLACAPTNSVPGAWSAATHRFDVVTQAPVAIPASPSPHHQFNYTAKQWQDTRTAASQWSIIRAERDRRLIESDWVVTKALELGGTVPAPWKLYRKALRDITLQADPFAVVWPVPPAA